MPRGSALGERRGGRVAGTPNRATIEVKAIAQQHGDAMIAELVRIAKESTSDAARISAIKEILDRGYGKAPQAVTGGGTDGRPVVLQIVTGVPRRPGIMTGDGNAASDNTLTINEHADI